MKMLIIQAFSLVLFVLGAVAEELRLVDQNGLIRALKIDASSSQVEVELVQGDGEPVPSSILLSRVDGINAPLEGQHRQGPLDSLSKGKVGVWFADVPPGIWRLEVEPKAVLEVRIRSEPAPKPTYLVHSTK
jgi:hypothetical protein